MRSVTIKGLLAKKGRLALSAFAIVLGVAFLSAAGVLSATIRAGADDVFVHTTHNADVEVRGAPAFASDPSADPAREPLPAAVLDTIRAVDGVAATAGWVEGYARIEDPDQNTIGTLATKTVGGSADGIGTVSPFELRSGRLPGGGEMLVDVATAHDHDVSIGDRVKVHFTGPAEELLVVGTVGYGELDGVPGTTFALFDLPTAQRVLGRAGQVDEVLVSAADGVTDAELARRVEEALPVAADVATGAERAGERSDQAVRNLRMVDDGTRVFALIALVVAGFIIVNTFTIVVAQRTGELALLRALGASRRQVRRSVLIEAAVTGLIASAVGTAAGVGLAAGLRAAVEAVGMDLPGSGVVVEQSAMIVPLVVGTALTMAAAFVPARRAAKLTPLAAMRDDTTGARPPRRRYVIGALVAAAGLALGVMGVPLVFVGVALLAPLFAGRLARIVGRPGAVIGRLPGRLGYENAARNPRRTASTASALMIGLALVVGLTVAAESALSTFSAALDNAVTADFIVDSEQTPLSRELGDRLAGRPELGAVSPMRAGDFELVSAPDRGPAAPPTGLQRLSAIDSETIGATSDLGYSEGALERLGDGGVLVSEQLAADHGWRVGDVLSMRFAKTGVQDITIDGTYGDDRLESDGFLLSLRDFETNYTDQLDIRVLVTAAPGVPAAEARAAVEEVVGAFPNARVLSNDEYKADFRSRLDMALAIVAVLLGLAVIIAVLGIVNTLALSIVERTRELGLLRAVGASRAQIRAMVRWEAITIALVGGVLGVAVGVQVGATLSRVLDTTEMTVPWARLGMFLVFAVIAGVGAAVLPARRAARLDVLAAVSHQ